MVRIIKSICQLKSDISGATAVEFAIMGSVMIALMFGFFDVAFSLYVKNSFNHAVNAAAREIYVDPDRTNTEIISDINARLARFNSPITAGVTTATAGSLEYKIISVQMDYNYKSPFLNSYTVTLEGESRAPILDYQL